MANEPDQAPVDAQDQPTPDAPQEGSAPEPDLFDEKFDPSSLPKELQDRYAEMNRGFTQRMQSASEKEKQWQAERQQYQEDVALVQALRNDPEYQQQVLRELAQAHGYEIDEPDQEGQPEQFFDPRVDEMLQERQAEQEQAWADQVEEQIYSGLDEIAQKDGVNLNDKERELLLRYVTMSPLTQDGRGNPVPDLQGAYDALSEVGEERIKRYVDSKNAPSLPPVGKAGSRDIDYSDPKARRKLGAAVIARGE